MFPTTNQELVILAIIAELLFWCSFQMPLPIVTHVVNVMGWIVMNIPPQGIWSRLMILSLSFPCRVWLSAEMRPVWWRAPGSHGDRGVLQGADASARVGCCVQALFEQWVRAVRTRTARLPGRPRRGRLANSCSETHTHLRAQRVGYVTEEPSAFLYKHRLPLPPPAIKTAGNEKQKILMYPSNIHLNYVFIWIDIEHKCQKIQVQLQTNSQYIFHSPRSWWGAH